MSIVMIIAIALATSALATSLVFYMFSREERIRNNFSRDLESTIRRHPAGKHLFSEEEIIQHD